MPGGDRTGPLGRGPMTGRGAGLCAGNPYPGYANPGYGRGWNRGMGRRFWGRGRRFWYGSYHDAPYYPPTRDEEKAYLENLVKSLEDELNAIKDRLQDLSKEKKEP